MYALASCTSYRIIRFLFAVKKCFHTVPLNEQIILNFKNKCGFDRRGAIIWRALRETSQNIEISVLQKAFPIKKYITKIISNARHSRALLFSCSIICLFCCCCMAVLAVLLYWHYLLSCQVSTKTTTTENDKIWDDDDNDNDEQVLQVLEAKQ